ncbi:MAG: VWA-like domain-containing protein [Bacillota bacterium]
MQVKEYQDVMVSFLLHEPFYAFFLSNLIVSFGSDVPTIGVSLDTPPRLRINRDFFESLDKKYRVGVLKHEVLHLVFCHPLRLGSRDLRLFNVAADLAVNEHIERSQLPGDVVTVDDFNEQFDLNLPHRLSAEEYYELLLKNAVTIEIELVGGSGARAGDGSGEDEGGKGAGGGSGAGEAGKVRIKVSVKGKTANYSGYHGEPEISGAAEVLEPYMKDLVQQVLNSAKSCGNLPGSLVAAIEAVYKTKVNWRRVLFRFLSGRGRMIPKMTYLKESKRFPEYPGKRKMVGLRALAAIDTSGSMTNEQLSEAFGQLRHISRVSGTDIWVVWGDVRCEGGPVPLAHVARNKVRIKGRGGTDLQWPFEIADKDRFPLVVYFTDGYGPAPQSAAQRTLWVLTKDGQRPAPFGDTVVLEV